MRFSLTGRLFVCAVWALGISRAGPLYSVYPIQTPAGWDVRFMFGLNNLGQAVGRGVTGGHYQAFIGTTSGSTPIPLPVGYSDAYAYGINDLGQVAGYATAGAGSPSQAFIGTGTGSSIIPLPAGWLSAQAFGINNSGQVAGFGDTGSTGQAFIGTTSGITPIPIPAGWSWTMARGINELGQVAGSGGPDAFNIRPFIGTASSSTPIPVPPGWEGVSTVYGRDINNSGQVAGDTFHEGPDQVFIGTTAGSTAIPKVPGWSAVYPGYFMLNDAGQVVGMGYGFAGGGAWIWDPLHGIQKLGDLVPAEWSIGDVFSINDKGQILAYGSSSTSSLPMGPILLVPIPEPATAALLTGGLFVLTALAFRRRHRPRAGCWRA